VHVIDLDTGARERLERTVEPYEAVPVRDGVAGMRGGRLVYQPVRGPDRAPRDLGRADRVLQAGRDDAVWTVVYPQNPSDARSSSPEVRLVTMSGDVERSLEIGSEPFWGTAAGLVSYDGGRIYLTDGRGARALAVGEVHGAAGNELVVRECDERRQCGFVRFDVSTGRRVALEIPSALGSAQMFAMSMAPTGEVALSTYGPDGPLLQLLDAAGQLVGSGPVDLAQPALVLSGLGLLGSTPEGEYVRVAPDGAGGLVVEELPAFEGLQTGATIVLVP
jgi:hypothetical protein